jgi:hypothetical protein
VHREACHRKGIQTASNTAGDYLAEAQKLRPEELDSTCLRSFHEGDLNRALFLREWSRRRCEELGDESGVRKHVIFQLNPLAGSVLAEQLVGNRPRWLDGKLLSHSACDPEILVAAGNVLVNSGFIEEGWERYQAIESDISRWRKSSDRRFGIIKRRVAIVTGEERDSFDALRFAWASQDKYTIRTALLCLGWSQFKNGKFGEAHNTFDKIQDEVVGPTSWWHITCKEFAVACAMYWERSSHRDMASILSRFLRAQYLNAFLGLQGIPVPDPRHGGTHSYPVVVPPTEMIRWLAGSHGRYMSQQRMTALRKSALHFLREEVIETLRRPNVKHQ